MGLRGTERSLERFDECDVVAEVPNPSRGAARRLSLVSYRAHTNPYTNWVPSPVGRRLLAGSSFPATCGECGRP